MAPGRGQPLTPPGLTVACQDRDFTEWHGGIPHALAWVLELDRPDVRALVAAGRERLGAHLLPRYHRQPHVTLVYAGLLDDHADARIEATLATLRPLLAGPVRLVAQGWGTFPMVPHLELSCDWLVRANRALTTDAPADHRMDFVPHVTLGHYAGTWLLSEPLALLASLPAVGAWEVAELSLARFESSDIAGELEVVGRLDLRTGRWRTLPG